MNDDPRSVAVDGSMVMAEKAHESDWGLMAQLMGQACKDPRAMSNLGAAQWRDMSRSLWGAWSWGAGDPVGGESQSLSASSSTGLRRGARLFRPSSAKPGAPLVVMLHGCMQDAESFAKLTRMDQIAREQGFNVLYPDQESSANPLQCWNWNAPENHTRLGGEPEALAGLIKQAQEKCGSPPGLTRLAGISAGAALAASMAHLYPELMGSVAVVAGPAPFSADTASQALREMAEGPDPKADMGRRMEKSAREAGARAMGPRTLPMLIVQGWADDTVNPKNADLQESGALMLNGALNRGAINGEPSAKPESCSMKEGSSKVWRDGRGQVLAVVVRPMALGHAWSGGDPSEPFSQPGFDQSRLALDFFEAAESGDWSSFHAKDLSGRLFGRRQSKAAQDGAAAGALGLASRPATKGWRPS